jgi:hypothetical protein
MYDRISLQKRWVLQCSDAGMVVEPDVVAVIPVYAVV